MGTAGARAISPGEEGQWGLGGDASGWGPGRGGSSQLLIWFWQHAAAARNNEVPADQ